MSYDLCFMHPRERVCVCVCQCASVFILSVYGAKRDGNVDMFFAKQKTIDLYAVSDAIYTLAQLVPIYRLYCKTLECKV